LPLNELENRKVGGAESGTERNCMEIPELFFLSSDILNFITSILLPDVILTFKGCSSRCKAAALQALYPGAGERKSHGFNHRRE
jgi:hypothetical protein